MGIRGNKNKKKNKTSSTNQITPESSDPVLKATLEREKAVPERIAACMEDLSMQFKVKGGTLSIKHTDHNQSVKPLFVVLKFYSGGYRATIYSFKVDGVSGEIITEEDKGQGVAPIGQFYDKDVRRLECARLCGSSRLYFLFYKGNYGSPPLPPPPQGIIYDTSTLSEISTFTLPGEKPYGPFISAYGMFYHFTNPCSLPFIPPESFEVYDPSNDRWEILPSCPFYRQLWYRFSSIGYAVCSGCILFCLGSTLDDTITLILFHIDGKKWHKVDIRDSVLNRHYPFVGKAVVVNDVIYTVAKHTEVLIIVCKLGIETTVDSTGSIAYSFFLDTLAALEPTVAPSTVAPRPTLFQALLKGYLTFIGDSMFCLFTTTNISDDKVKCVSVTTFRIAFGEDCSMYLTTLHSRTLKFYYPENSGVDIALCFIADSEDTEIIENKNAMLLKCIESTISATSDVMDEFKYKY